MYIGQDITRKIRFNKAEKLSDLHSQTLDETTTIYENRDIAITDLKTPRLTGKLVNFDAPLTREQINILADDATGLIKYYDYFAKKYKHGWIKEVSTNRVDKSTNWQLYEAQNVDVVANNLEYMDGDDVLLMNGERILLNS